MLPIVTSQFQLRAPEGRDAPLIARYLGNFETTKWLARPPFPYSLADAEAFLADLARCPETDSVNAAIEIDGALAGMVSVQWRGDVFEFGYWLAPPYRGRGLATTAGRVLLTLFFNQNPVASISAGYFAGNSASARVLEKLGFQAVGDGLSFNRPQGRYLPHVDVVLTREQFQAQRS